MSAAGDFLQEYWARALAGGALAACLRALRPQRLRRLLAYVTAVKEYETETSRALYWKAKYLESQTETETERQWGQHWKTMYEDCRSGSTRPAPPIRTPPSDGNPASDAESG